MTDKTRLIIHVGEETVDVIVRGTVPAIVEIGEQLAWLGAALQSSASADKISLSTPHVTADLSFTKPRFSITFPIRELESETKIMKTQNGTCWRPLFNNPVVVEGYPITRRQFGEGLEIPLNMMAGLGEATRTTKWDDGLLIKGFSTMFCPMAMYNGSIQWHYIFDATGDRLSYLAADLRCRGRLLSPSLDTSCLPRLRHFLGWASSVETFAGKLTSTFN